MKALMLLLILLATSAKGESCIQLLAKLSDPLLQKNIHLDEGLNTSAIKYWRNYFSNPDAELIPMPINRTSYHPINLAQHYYGSVENMVKELNLTLELTPKRWKKFLATDDLEVRWIVRGDGKIISWRIEESDQIYEATLGKLAKVLGKPAEVVKEMNPKDFPDGLDLMQGCHQDILALMAGEESIDSVSIVAYGYLKFMDGVATLGTNRLLERGVDTRFDILNYIKAYFK